MSKAVKSISEINKKLKKGSAVIMTAMEFKKEVRSGYRFKVSDVDVVTTGTRGVMSGTSAMLLLPLGACGSGRPVGNMWINGVPCYPAANSERENSGNVETVIYGTTESVDHQGRYGGGHVLRDLVEGKQVEVECVTGDGKSSFTRLTLDRLKFARLYNYRNDFQNYMAFSNIKNQKSYRLNPTSIFACRPIPRLRGLTVSGSGEMNPLENDRFRKVLKAGMKILLNGAPGVIVGYGTRSTPAKGCLYVSADIGDRIGLTSITYADIWKDARLEVEFDPERCICCSFQCPAEYYCPMNAISWKDKKIDETLCVACGACTSNCLGGAFKGKGDLPRGCIGTVRVFNRDVPIIFRQSNRYRSEMLAVRMKEVLENGDFLLTDSDFDLQFRAG